MRAVPVFKRGVSNIMCTIINERVALKDEALNKTCFKRVSITCLRYTHFTSHH